MGYLKLNHSYRLAMDPNYLTINNNNFETQDWTAFYGDSQEATVINAPAPRGKSVVIRMMVDSEHAGDVDDRRSCTGYMIYVQMSLIDWLSNKQANVEKAVFGSNFFAMTHGVETLRGPCYKLRMMGVPIDEPTYIFGDNMSVIFNTSRPQYQLRKKSNSISYHAVREAVAMGKCINIQIPT